MTIKEMADKTVEIEKAHGVSVYVGYNTDTKWFEFCMYKKNARLVRRFSTDEMIKWDIDDFEAQLERMADEICSAVEYHKTKEVVE